MTAERSWRPLALLVAGAFFMEILDGTVIATAAPSIAASFGVRSADVNIVITVYLVTLAVFIPASGWLADRFGHRTVFSVAIAVFTIASALCAVSTGLWMLTGFRVLQGIGGAMMVPVGRLVVLRGRSKADLMHAIAYLTWPALVAPLIAPVVGGALATYASWRWIFILNVPLGILALGLSLRMVPNTTEPLARRLDWRGFLLLGSGLALLLVGLEQLNRTSVHWLTTGLLTAAGMLLVLGAIRHLLRRPDPLVNLGIMRIATFRIANVSGSFYRTAISAVPFLLPLMFQDAFGWSPFKAGLLVMLVFAGNLGIKPFTTPLLRRFGFRPVLLVTGISGTVVIVASGLVTENSPLWLIGAVLFVGGVLRSVGFTVYNGLSVADVASHEMRDANTLTATLQQLTAGLGVAIGALALRVAEPFCEAVGLADVEQRTFTVAFVLVGVIALVAVLTSLSLSPRAGTEVSNASRRA